ncbi:MAG: hypothetical protein DRH06_01980 [Deltaproteobacteria bacterium]|nr:MAG: hypothetical protein DRH06_01980 [Deltaproteobacteria bacterium]
MISVIVQSEGGQVGVGYILTTAAWEIGGAVLSGVLLGLPMAYLSGRIRPDPVRSFWFGLALYRTGRLARGVLSVGSYGTWGCGG